MARTRPNHWDLIWIGGAAVVFLLFAFPGKTPLVDLARLLVAIVVVALCISDWRAKGHRWVPTLSWTIPLGIWLFGPWLVGRPGAVVLFAFWLGFAFMLAMLASTRAATWWYRVVLRRTFKT